MAGVEERLAEDERAEKDGGYNDGKESPGLDVELVVGLGLVAHGRKVKGKGKKVKGGVGERKKSARNGVWE